MQIIYKYSDGEKITNNEHTRFNNILTENPKISCNFISTNGIKNTVKREIKTDADLDKIRNDLRTEPTVF